MNNKGFTLIELIVTIALLAIISTISFVSISGAIEKNKDKKCESIRSTLKSAASYYVSDNRYKKNIGPNDNININISDLALTTDTFKNPHNEAETFGTKNGEKISITLKNYEIDTMRVLNGTNEIEWIKCNKSN